MGKYEEALERARQGKPIDEVFPELKESEDERIRKGLIEIFNSALGQDFLQRKAGLDRDKVIAYLEKQKEQKPASIPYGHENDKPTEDWREKRKEECPFRKTLDNNLFGCERDAGAIFACDGRCSWVVDYPKLKEIQEKKEQKEPIPDKFSGLKSLMQQYLQSAANRKDDAEIENDTDLYCRKILDYVWKCEGLTQERRTKNER